MKTSYPHSERSREGFTWKNRESDPRSERQNDASSGNLSFSPPPPLISRVKKSKKDKNTYLVVLYSSISETLLYDDFSGIHLLKGSTNLTKIAPAMLNPNTKRKKERYGAEARSPTPHVE